MRASRDRKRATNPVPSGSNDSQVMIMDNDAARVIRDITNIPIYVPDGKGEIDMCKAVRDMIDESKQEGIAVGRAEGKAEGRAEGKAEGKAEGRAEGKAEGKAEGILITLIDLVRDNSLSIEKAAVKAHMTVEQFKKVMETTL